MSASLTKPRPRVLVVGQGAPGGIGRVEQLVAEAALAGPESFASDCLAVWRRRHPEYLRDGTALERLPTVGGGGDVSEARFVRDVASAIRAFRPEHVMYTHVNHARLAMALRGVGHPRSYSVWTYGVEVWEPRSFAHRLAMRRADHVLTISNFTADATVREQGVSRSKISIIPLSLPATAFDAPHDPNAVVPGRILSVSRLDASEGRKNLDQLIRAMVSVRREHPSAELVIVGDGASRGELQQLAHDLGVADAVSLPGRLSDEALAQAYREADLFVLPSEKEGFGLVFIEAMLQHTPAVGVRAGGVPDVIRDGVDGTLLDSPAELPDQLNALLSDREQLEHQRSAVRPRVEQHFGAPRFQADLSAALGTPNAPR